MGIFLILYYIFNIAYRLGPDNFRWYFEKIVIQFKYFLEKTPITWVLGFYVTSVVQVSVQALNQITHWDKFIIND